MADSVDSKHQEHGTSDELVDPFCDLCYELKDLNVTVCGFCKDCFQFLCSDCYGFHGKLQASKHHDVVHGDDMPKSQADKPPRFDHYDDHPKLLKDEFCSEHKILLCSVCSSSEHSGCTTKKVEDFCRNVHFSEICALYDKIKHLQDTLKAALVSLDKELKKLTEQEKTMLDDAQQINDQIIANVNKLFSAIKNKIQTSCQTQRSVLYCHQNKVNDIILKLDSPLSELKELKGRSIDTKIFLRLQDTVSFTRRLTTERQESFKSLTFDSLSFVPSKAIQEILSATFTPGTIQKSKSCPLDVDIVVPQIMFPVSTPKRRTAQPTVGQIPGASNIGESASASFIAQPTQSLSKIKATKQNSYNIKLTDDFSYCWITGMAMTRDKRILMTDSKNNKVKSFSYDMKFLSSVSVPDLPSDIAVISDKEAAVTANKSLVILDISGSQLSIKTTTRCWYPVYGISRCNSKLVVTSACGCSSVKLIDQTGGVYWSVSSDQQGQRPFKSPWYVCSHEDERSSTVIEVDWGNDTLVLLNGNTGDVITTCQLQERKKPRGVITDSAGNVYVCYWETSEVSVLSRDLSEEKILLSRQNGLSDRPQAIAYDDTAHQLIISYFSIKGPSDINNHIDKFKLS